MRLSFLLVMSLTFAHAQSLTWSSSLGLSWDPANPPAVSAQHRDWFTGAFPLFVTPSQTAATELKINPDSGYHGTLQISAVCCGIVGVPGLAMPGVSTLVGSYTGTVSIPSPFSRAFGLSGSQSVFTLPSSSLAVAGVPTQKSLLLKAGPSPVVGDWLVQVHAQDPAHGIDRSMDILLSVLPAWPPDGPPTPCTAGLENLPLSAANLYSLKANNLSNTSIQIGTVFSGQNADKGMIFTIHDPGVPLASNLAMVSFKNNNEWHVGIRTVNSHNCAGDGLLQTVESGQTARFSISTADTTSLVFSKPTCGFKFIVCWGSIGLQDIVQLSEGPFWLYFGGHAVDIATVGDWAGFSAFGEGQIIPPK